MEGNSLKVDLLGTSLNIRSKENPKYLNQVVDCLKIRISQLESDLSVKDPLKIALLAALNLADELITLQAVQKDNSGLSNEESSEIGQIATSLIERIDNSLSGLPGN